MTPIFWAIGIGAGLLGLKLITDSKPSSSTPLQNNMNAKPYQIGQKVRVPLNQLPANTIPDSMLATFNQVGTTVLIVQVTAVMPGTIQGNLLSTTGPNGEIMLPVPVPITIPVALISGLA